MPKIHIKNDLVCRMSGYKFYFPDEMDDVSDYAKEYAQKLIGNTPKIKVEIKKSFQPLNYFDDFCNSLIGKVNKMAEQLERDLLLFADRFKTRRVYCVEFHKDNNFRMDFYSKMFKYEDRALAFDMARRFHGLVKIYDFKKLVESPLVFIQHMPSPNRREAEELWKTFNTCCLCHSDKNVCTNVLFMGKNDRMCFGCLNEIKSKFIFRACPRIPSSRPATGGSMSPV